MEFKILNNTKKKNNNEEEAEGNMFWRMYRRPPPGCYEPTYNLSGTPSFGPTHPPLREGSTLHLPHWRGIATVRCELKNLPRKGDCTKCHANPTSGIYLNLGAVFYKDYEGEVYHRVPLEHCEEQQRCEVVKRVGRMTASDGSLVGVLVCSDDCVLFERRRGEHTVLKWVKNPIGAPLWVQSCSDEKGAKPKNKSKQQNDRMAPGKMVTKPKEVEADQKTRPPDATIVVDGQKYQVRKKGKAKPKTPDGLYHNKNKPEASRKKLEKALLAWAVIAIILIQQTTANNVTQWNLWDDKNATDVHSVMYQRQIKRSLHGIWPERICKGVPGHLATDYELKRIEGMLDASEKTNFTCCRLQRHEWNKHGWCNWYNIDPWVAIMNRTQALLSSGKNFTECAVTCRYDTEQQINIVTQARMTPTILTGCKKDVNFSFSGEVRTGPCNYELKPEDLMRILDHTNCKDFSYFGEGLVDDFTEATEKIRSSGYRALSWLQDKLEKTKKKVFGAEATPYCNVTRRVFNIIYTNNCTPAGLPDNTRIVGPGTFDISEMENKKLLPNLDYHLADFMVLGLVALSDFAPETASTIYLVLHYWLPQAEVHTLDTPLDTNKLNLTRNRQVSSVVPNSIWLGGELVCVKPRWWPYSAEITTVISGLTTVTDLVVKTIVELVSLWTEATAVAFLAALIKIFRGQPIQALAWLIIIGGAQGLECNFELQYALAGNTSMSLLGPTALKTQWYQAADGVRITDGVVTVICNKGIFTVTPRCKEAPVRYLAINHPRSLSTSAWFRKIHDPADHPTETLMSETGRAYLCPRGATPLPKSKVPFNPITIQGSAFSLTCPRNWQGDVECNLISPDTLAIETIYTFRKHKPYKEEPYCSYTKVVEGYLRTCTYGGNDTCVAGDIINGSQDDSVTKCKWCGYEFNSTTDLPDYPIGYCTKRGTNYLIRYKQVPCEVGGVRIGSGKVECIIGSTRVKVEQTSNELGPMPCKPIVYSSQGPPNPKTCTFKWSYTLNNKYYEPRDEFFQQYITSGGYQYWFDLTAKDHVMDWVTRYFPIIVVALLGGRAVLWILIAYELLNHYQVGADQNTLLQAEALVIGNILMTRDLEVMVCFLLLMVLIRRQQARRALALVFHWMVMHPAQSAIATLVYVIGIVRAEEGQVNSDSATQAHVVAILLFLIYHTLKERDLHTAMTLLLTFSIKSTDYVDTHYYEIPMLFTVISSVISIYIFNIHIKTKWVALVLSMVGMVSFIRCLWLIRNIQITPPSIPLTYISPKILIIAYLVSLTVLVNNNLDLASYVIRAGPMLMSYLTLWVDILMSLVLLPWYELIKVYYLKKKKDDIEDCFQYSGIATQGLSPYNQDFVDPKEGVHLIPSQNKSNFTRTAYLTILRALVLTAFSSIWKPLILAELLLESIYWTHIKVAKEVAGSTRLIGRFVAALIELNWVFDDKEAARYKKFFVLTSRVRDLMVKHKVQNDTMRQWFEETEIFGLQKVALVVRAHSLTADSNSILCSVCEEKQNIEAKRVCPKCGNRGTGIKCGMTLAEFEEKYYKKIYLVDGDDTQAYRREERGAVTYTARGAFFLRNLPILATKNKYILVGNLGMELQDLESMGWIIRGPAVCKKIVHHERCRPTIPDKLMAFFGLMPRGVVPRAPTRFPVSLLKIKRGFETGWAYTHPGGISSVMHVTAGLDMYVNDAMGRTKVQCQERNKLTDECEYGIKTDSGCSEGARCYVINPEAVNIAGTRGAMVHLRKTGPEFTCVTAQGTPAFYNLRNLKGWSGLPIFEAATGRVVGRVKAGKNAEDSPTTIMSGTQAAKPTECDLESVVRKLETMNRGEFKQVVLATGAGKTTELPRKLIEAVGRHKRVLVLIPLRAAAEGVYNYMRTKHPSIAFNLRIGDLKEGDMATGITYASYGYFCQMDMPRLDAAMKEYNYIFLDEYHCATPEQLAVMSKIHRISADLRVVAMTATPAGAVSKVGQKFSIEEVVVPEVMKGEDLGEDYLDIAGLKIPKSELQGNVLTFVPTKKLASETAKKLTTQGYNAGYYFSGEDPSSLRTITSKSPYIIIATNAIESGVTLPDLDTVIDTGMKCEKRVRIENKAPYIITGLKRMAITTGEQAQRKGRVGRVKPGRYLRGPENAGGERDYHYDLLQAQRYGLQDAINITKSFREMNYDWALYEEDPLRITQLEVLNTLLISKDLPTVTKNLMTRTTHPEPIQLAYNSIETPVPVLFPKVKGGEVTDAYETYELMMCRKLDNDPPIYLYATEDEDLAVDLLNLKWPAVSTTSAIETEDALNKLSGLSAGETALLVALLGWVGYEALVKRHIPIVTDIYTIEDEKLEDTTHLQYSPDELQNTETVELKDLSAHELKEALESGKGYVKDAFEFVKSQVEKLPDTKIYKQVQEKSPGLLEKFLAYLSEHSSDIKKYGLWGVHTSLYNSIKERLGHETAFASLIIKWIAFSSEGLPGMVKQAAVDLVVYYLINKPDFKGDEDTQDDGRKFVGALFVSALADYTFKDFNKSILEGLVMPALNYLPYAGAALKIFVPTKLESLVILSTTIYRTYLSIKKGSSQGLAGLAVSSGMEIMNQNPISVAIAVALGVGAIAAHNAIESSEAKRTLLMKVFVKNFLDQAATDELVKENPEKIIMAVFEAIQTAGNPIRLIYHLYAMFYKGWNASQIADKTAGRNIFVLTIFEGLELLGLDKDSKWRDLSSNYLVDAIRKLIEKLTKILRNTTKSLIKSLLPAPFSCTRFTRDNRIGWPHLNFDYYEINCACGYRRRVVKTVIDPVTWETLEEEGPEFCFNRGTNALANPRVASYYSAGEPVLPVVKREGVGEILVRGVTIQMHYDHNKILATDNWQVPFQAVTKIFTDYQGIGYQEAYLGTQPNYKALVKRSSVTITKEGLKFIRCKKGIAYTTNLNLTHIQKLVQVCRMNELQEGVIPETLDGDTWINYMAINEDVGATKPSFGERVIPEPYEEDPLEGPSVIVETGDVDITKVGVNQQSSSSGTVFQVVEKIYTKLVNTNVIKIGFKEGCFPGPTKNVNSLNEHIEDKDSKPYIFICSSDKAMSNRVKTARNIKKLNTNSAIVARNLAREGKLIIIVLGEKYHEDIYKHADFKGTFLDRKALEALSKAKPVKKNMTRKEAQHLLEKKLSEDIEVPEWLGSEKPMFLDVTKSGETYHLLGDLNHLKAQAEQLGAKATTTINKVGKTYTMNLSTWWESERTPTFRPLFQELLLRCRPCTREEYKSCHFVGATQLAGGNWKPVAPVVHLGTIPAKREKCLPYEAYISLKNMVENLKIENPGVCKKKHQWLLNKIKKRGELGLKNLVSPGSVGDHVVTERKKFNIYNKQITSTMLAVGIKPEKLPVVRAQTSKREFHQAIREKIDKLPNPQNRDLHKELKEIFDSVCAVKDLKHTYEEVSWDVLTVGINRKGAAGYFEKKNVGEIIDTDRRGVEKLIKVMKTGGPIDYYETAIPKNEKRAVVDDWLEGDFVEEKKPRVIQYPEAKMRLAITKVMYNWVKQKPVVIPGYEGKTPLFKVFDKVFDEWKQLRDPVAVSFDTKAWDTQVTPEDLQLISEIQKYYFKPKYHKFIETLTTEMKEVPVVCQDGEVYIRLGQRGSGQPDTSAGNSMLNVLTMIYAFCKSNDIPYKAFRRVAKIHVCGDDGFLITERRLGENFAAMGPQILMEAGKPQKLVGEMGLKLAYKFQDIEFCSHTPIQVRWDDNTTSYLPGRDTATILAKMCTRLDSAGERGTSSYELAVVFSFLLMYSWNPIVRRICLLVMATIGVKDPDKSGTIFTFSGDPLGAYKEVIGHRLGQLKQTEFSKLASCNLSMSLLGIYSRHTSKRIIEDCVKIGTLNRQSPVNADRLIAKKTGFVYEPSRGSVRVGKHYEELELDKWKKKTSPIEGAERYIPGPIKTFILKRLKVLQMIGLKFF
nr:polyprotein [Linda virus]